VLRGKVSFGLLIVNLLMFTLVTPYVLFPLLVQASPGAKIFVSPEVLVDTSKGPGSTFTVDINVSDVPTPGLVAYEFYMKWNPTTFLSYPVKPLVNPNFTDTGSTKWSTTTYGTVTGTPSFGYDASNGNIAAPSYYLRANATPTATASIDFYTDQTFNFTFGKLPTGAYLSYAHRVTGNSIPASGSVLYIDLIGPPPSYTYSRLKTIGISGSTTWVYVPLTETFASKFVEKGTYTFRLYSRLKTAATGTDKYIQVNWDDVQLKLNPINVAEGPFLKQGGTTYMTSKYFEEGYIYVSNTLTGTPYVNAFPQPGSGRIANVTFYVQNYNETALDLYDTILLTYGPPPGYPPTSIDHTSQDGYFANIEVVHDVAVTNVTVSPTTALDGQIVSINVTVQNQGVKSETFDVSTYYDSNLIQTKTVSNLAGGNASTTVQYSWNTAGVAPGTYTIKAVASPLPGETDKADNTYTDGTVTVAYTHNVAVISVVPSKTSIYLNESITITVVAKNKGTTTETFTVTAYNGTAAIETKTVSSLAAGANQTLLYTWNTTNTLEGSYLIKAVASNVTGEIYTVDNTYIDGIVEISPKRDVAVLSVDASPTTVNEGQNVTITVVVKNNGQQKEDFELYTFYDDTATGTSQTVSNLAVGANRTLTIIWNTTSVSPGTYTIKADASLPADVNQTDNVKIDGTVTVIVRDVAVLTVTPANTTIYVKMNVKITVVVKNEGGPYAENFTLTLYYNTTIIATQEVTNLAPGTNTTIIIYWNTAGVALGKYQIKAVASTVSGEIDTADNTKIYGMVTVKVADANGDSIVDVFDLALFGKAWQSTSGQPNYNVAVDFNNDGVVNVADFALLGLNWGYGKEWT